MRKLKQLIAMILVACMIITLCPSDASAATTRASVKSVTVTNLMTNKLVLKRGATFQVKPKVVVTGNASKKVIYLTSNKKVATVDSKGVIKAVKAGSAVVAVRSAVNSKIQYKFVVYVGTPTASVTLSANAVAMLKGSTKTLRATIAPKNATYKGIKWSSSDTKIATVTEKGVVKAVKVGTAYITAKAMDGSGKSARCKVVVKQPVTSIKISATNLSVVLGTTKTLKAVAYPVEAANRNVKFSSGNTKIATVTAKGVIKGVALGKVAITVKAADGSGVATKCIVNVVKQPVTGVKISDATCTITEGSKKTLTATVTPATATNKNVTWTSSNAKVAKVDKGVVTAVAPGTATITVAAADGSGKKAICKVTVKKKLTIATKYESKGYKLLWNDEFSGTELNRDIWNVECHEPGWVNNELQAYVDSEENIKVGGGTLTISPKKVVNEDGTISYTSGRVNTQNKKDFKYGRIQFRAKVPEGKGFLPAAWMMPTNESLYGQWPRCGEIDVMEVRGHETDISYGTIHYGNPHSESQGQYKIENGKTFADSYHIYTCDWEPGKITWYVDDVKIHEESDWYSTTTGKGTVAYPAPFDQPFYVILNLAVGGNWPGNPDDDADYINSQSYKIDYVRVYQKDSYDENVEKPVHEIIIREPDENGNYVINGDFSNAEDLTDEDNWKFMAQEGGEGTAAIENGAINISTTKAGDQQYSIQLVNQYIPAEKGATYKLSFDAWADETRTGIVDVSAPTRSWVRYLADTEFTMTTDKQSYEYEYTMTDSDNDKARIEFNFGKLGSVAGVHIANVKVFKTNQVEIVDKKTILADGNLVYNGEFQEGTGRLEYWTIANPSNADYKVTGLSDGRRFSVKATDDSKADSFVLSQDELAYSPNTKYVLKFDAETASENKTIKISTGDNEFEVALEAGKKSYIYKFETGEEVADKSISIDFGNSGEVLLDNVKIIQDALLLNGSFSADFSGFEVYVDGSASADAVVDSQKEDNAADFTVKNSGDQNWKIQLKQSNVKLEKGKWYKLSFDVKSSMARSIQYAIQRDGSTHKDSTGAEDWTPYVQETVKLDAYDQDNQEFTKVSKTFQMGCDTDAEGIFNIALGAGGKNGAAITDQHRIVIDNIVLEETDPVEIEVPEGENLLVNPEFAMDEDGNITGWEQSICEGAVATCESQAGAVTYNITNAGDQDWGVQIKQKKLVFAQGEEYTVKCTLASSIDRIVKVSAMSDDFGYAWHGGADISLTANEPKEVEFTFTPSEEIFTEEITADNNGGLNFSMGNITVDGVMTSYPEHTVTISNVSFTKKSNGIPAGVNLLTNPEFAVDEDGNMTGWENAITAPGVGSYETKDGAITYSINNVGDADWNIQLKQMGLSLEQGATYTLKCTLVSDVDRVVKLAVMTPSAGYAWHGGDDVVLKAGEPQEISIVITPKEEVFSEDITVDTGAGLFFSMGYVDGYTLGDHTVTISDVSFMKN